MRGFLQDPAYRYDLLEYRRMIHALFFCTAPCIEPEKRCSGHPKRICNRNARSTPAIVFSPIAFRDESRI